MINTFPINPLCAHPLRAVVVYGQARLSFGTHFDARQMYHGMARCCSTASVYVCVCVDTRGTSAGCTFMCTGASGSSVDGLCAQTAYPLCRGMEPANATQCNKFVRADTASRPGAPAVACRGMASQTHAFLSAFRAPRSPVPAAQPDRPIEVGNVGSDSLGIVDELGMVMQDYPSGDSKVAVARCRCCYGACFCEGE